MIESAAVPVLWSTVQSEGKQSQTHECNDIPSGFHFQYHPRNYDAGPIPSSEIQWDLYEVSTPTERISLLCTVSDEFRFKCLRGIDLKECPYCKEKLPEKF